MVIAYNAKNLVPVSSIIRGMLPIAKFIIIADNDESGTGKKCADEAAEKSGAEVIMPPEIGDANDYLLSGGDLEGLLDPVVPTWLEPASSYRMNPKPVRWLIKHWLQDNALVMVHGPSGCGKTFVVLDWSLRIASEDMDSWCGEIVHHGSVVHHTGVSSEAQHRARGSSSWRGALENEISVEKKHHSESIRVIDRKTKDGKDSDDKFLDLTEVIIKGWLDEDGEPVSSAVVTEGVAPSQQQRDAK